MTSRIIARLTSVPWLIQAEALETMLQIAGRGIPDQETIEGWKHEASRLALATRPGDPLGTAPSARVRDGVAIVPVAGPIFRYANLFTQFSGATALADVAANLAAARADGRVRAVMLEIDSPGGDVTGLAEAADMIAQLAAEKPVVAYVEGAAQSAAYWLASAAAQIVISATGQVGSLGAVVAMQDTRERQARDGVRRYEFISSQTPNKRLDPTTDAGAARVQALADRLAAEFLQAAAANRGMTVEDIIAATDGGGILVGADAVRSGLADRVGGFEETLQRLSSGEAPMRATPPPPSRASAGPSQNDPSTGPHPRATSQETPMSDPAQPDAPAPVPDTTTIAAAAPQDAAPQPDPVQAERARTQAILAAAKPEFTALAQVAVAEGWPVDLFARAQEASASAVASARTAAEAAAFRDSLPQPVANAGPAAPDDPQARWKAEYAASADLQREFGGESTYLAFKQAEAAGKVRSLPRRTA